MSKMLLEIRRILAVRMIWWLSFVIPYREECDIEAHRHLIRALEAFGPQPPFPREAAKPPYLAEEVRRVLNGEESE